MSLALTLIAAIGGLIIIVETLLNMIANKIVYKIQHKHEMNKSK